jgi:cbb3-type cytochrome oxidase maturation protein
VETIFVLLPLALLIAAIAVGFFVWAARSGQFDDLETPAVRILFDDLPPPRPAEPPAPADEAAARQARGADSEARSLEPEAGRVSSRRRVSE